MEESAQPLPISDPLARYLRVKFSYASAEGPKQAYELGRKELERHDLPTFDSRGWFAILGNEPANRFPDVGECIYCGGREFRKGSGLPLSEEHIVPEGLGARLILPFASCEECEKSTKRFEQVIIRDMLRPARRRMGIRGKKRRKGPDKPYEISVIKDGIESHIEVPLLEHPTSILLPKFGIPGRITPFPDQSGFKSVWAVNLAPHDEMLEKGYNEFATLPLDTVCFCQLLSKMAHGLAIANFGISGFQSLLTPFIRANYKKQTREGEWLDRYQYIGTDQTEYESVNALHVYSFICCTAPNDTYLVVRIRLFSYYPTTPVYYVVTGTLTGKQLQAIRGAEAIP